MYVCVNISIMSAKYQPIRSSFIFNMSTKISLYIYGVSSTVAEATLQNYRIRSLYIRIPCFLYWTLYFYGVSSTVEEATLQNYRIRSLYIRIPCFLHWTLYFYGVCSTVEEATLQNYRFPTIFSYQMIFILHCLSYFAVHGCLIIQEIGHFSA